MGLRTNNNNINAEKLALERAKIGVVATKSNIRFEAEDGSLHTSKNEKVLVSKDLEFFNSEIDKSFRDFKTF